MAKASLGAACALLLLSAAGCGQGPAEKAGEAADSAYEQSTTGRVDPTDGPAENAGEAIDHATDAATPPPDAATTTTTTTTTTTP